ncbi:Auxin transporter-like protein [Drosera capensis]
MSELKPEGSEAAVGEDEKGDDEMGVNGFSVKGLLWHGRSVYDAWFSCASNQVAQVPLTLPYFFSQMGMASGVTLQAFYGMIGSWTAYLISVLYIEYRIRREREGDSFKNHVIHRISTHACTVTPHRSLLLHRPLLGYTFYYKKRVFANHVDSYK